MKKFLAGVIGLAAMGLAAPASAADVAPRPYAPAYSYIPALYDWSGFYIGANGGYGTNRSCWDSVNTSNAFLASEGCHNASGGVAGAQFGYRGQAGSWVFGVEAQGDWAGLRGSNINTNPAAVVPGALTNRSRIDSFGLFTAQLGYAMDNTLFYVKGGGAVVDDRYDIYSGGAFVATNAYDQPRWGGTAGAGLEYGFAPNWSAAIEYDHLFMRDRIAAFTTTVPPSTPTFSNERIRQSVDMVTVRVNYRWGGPIIAKY